MELFGSKDRYSVERMGALGEGSFSSLSDLYMPLLGAKAYGLYFALYGMAEQGKERELSTLAKATSLTYAELFACKKPLEALGLLKTYLAKDEQGKAYRFVLYMPASPRIFFSNILLSGLLSKSVGEGRYQELKERYQERQTPENMQDVSSNFLDVFHPDMGDAGLASATFSASLDGPAPLAMGFDASLFEEALKKLGYSSSLLSQPELEFIEQYGALYAYSSSSLGEFAGQNLLYSAPFGQRLNRKGFAEACRRNVKVAYLRAEPVQSEVSSDTPLAKKIAAMDSLTPVQWLRIKQNMRKPAAADLRILENLEFEIGLPAPAINALVDYLLEKNDNRLSAALAEKLAAELVRADVASSRDAMEYLNAQIRARKGRKKEPDMGEETPIHATTATEVSPEDDGRLERLLADYEAKKKGAKK